ncbi:MAG TPA: hypothetical protein VEM58_00010 [Streptosporangiaceae bacterium]|nr:hypothetical protein [Streptosporangiaceae bacterium]
MTTAWYRPDAQPAAIQYAASKVPAITVYFWIIKILTTGMGETTSDFMVHRFSPYFAVAVGGVGFAVAMALQFSVRRYVTWVYWLAIVMVSVFGTMVADVTHIVLGVPYALSTTVFIVVLGAIFFTWQTTENTLSIHSIRTSRRELFYWATVMATFALGTAAGDMTARTLKLGFFASGVLFALVFAIPAIAHWKLGMNPVLAFWFAYVVTRPFGASFADWMAIPHSFGGLGYGYGPISAVLTILIIGFVGYLAVTGKDSEERSGARSSWGGRHRARHRAQPIRGRTVADPPDWRRRPRG